MKVITLATQKGGGAKSALVISFAVLASQPASRVLILDADPQGTARQWHEARNGNSPEVRSVRNAAELEATLNALSSDSYDFVFIDTPGRDEPGEAAALTIIPCRPTMADVRAVPATAAVAQRLKRPFTIVLAQVPTRGTRADETAAALGRSGGGRIDTDRPAYRVARFICRQHGRNRIRAQRHRRTRTRNALAQCKTQEVEVMPKRPAIKLPKPESRDTVITELRDSGKPPKRYIKATLYLLPAVHEELRKLAFQQRRSQHELLQEGVDVVLEKYCGKTSHELTANKE